MRGHRVVVAALIVAGSATAIALGAAEETIGPDPVVAEWPGWPFEAACYWPPFEPASAFSTSAHAEDGADPAAAELRSFLAEPGKESLPKDGWRLLANDGRYADFFTGHLEGQNFSVGFKRTSGGWEETHAGSCTPRTVRNGRAAVGWKLFGPPIPRPTSRMLKIRVLDLSCSSGKSPNRRVKKPVILEFGSRLVITLWVRPLVGGGHCGPVKPCPYRLRLPTPLGNRTLYDGSTYPPHEVAPPSVVFPRPARARSARAKGGPRRSRWHCKPRVANRQLPR